MKSCDLFGPHLQNEVLPVFYSQGPMPVPHKLVLFTSHETLVLKNSACQTSLAN